MLPWSRASLLCVPVALAACGSNEGAEVDTSLGLDERPANSSCIGSGEFPTKLSNHACFEGDLPRVGAALVPYSVNAPLWSDGADKQRYLALPDDSALSVARSGDFELPPGGVLVKEFSLGDTRLETRLITRDTDGDWHAATYVWDTNQRDATHTTDGASIELDDAVWLVPTNDQCFACHTERAGIALGLEQRQMALEFEYPATGRTADQIHTLSELGLLEGESDDDPLVPPGDEDADLEARARAYLHANCAHCHSPGGEGQGELDLRASTPTRLTKTCNELPQQGDPVESGGVLLAPGDPASSILYVRMTSEEDSWRMPPVGSVVVDDLGSALIADWIESFESCPE
ncbi:MAG TPA: c-type cytochrome domain-containing protein [Polyangiaceae bacterium]